MVERKEKRERPNGDWLRDPLDPSKAAHTKTFYIMDP